MPKLAELLKDTWFFLRTNFTGLCAVLLPLLIPLNFISTAAEYYSSDEAQYVWLAIIFEITAFPLYQGALVFFLAAMVKGEQLPVSQYYKLAVKFWLPLILLYLATGLAMLGGFLLLILPGLIVAARVAFAEFYCLLHEQAPLDAFKSSWEQARKYQWTILAGLLVIALAVIILFSVLDWVVVMLGLNGAPYTFISSVAASILYASTTIFCFRVFTLHLETQNPSNGETKSTEANALSE